MIVDYFQQLNYTFGNEDLSLEYLVLKKNLHHVYAVAGSGSRAIIAIAKNPNFLTLVDKSKRQLQITELKIASIQYLNHEDYLSFWGYLYPEISGEQRQKLFNKIKISSETQNYFIELFNKNKWQSILYEGKWEKTFIKLNKILKIIVGKKIEKLTNFTNNDDYQNFIVTKFPYIRWKIALWLLGNATIFNILLYHGKFPKKNISKSYYIFYRDIFNKLLKQELPRNNFFLNIIMNGKLISKNALPIECHKEIFNKAKHNIKNISISYQLGDVIDEIANLNIPIDCCFFSDTPSYFNGEKEKNFLKYTHSKLAADGLIVFRNYLRVPENVIFNGFVDIANNYQTAINNEKVGMYEIKILKKI